MTGTLQSRARRELMLGRALFMTAIVLAVLTQVSS